MLINTVLVFLNSALPAFFFISISASLMKPYAFPNLWKISVLIISILSAFFLSHSMSVITELFDGMGFEMLSAFIYLLVFFILLWQLYLNRTFENSSVLKLITFASGTVLIFIVDGTNLFVYLNGFWSSLNSTNSILIGSILGLGISLSSALLLLYFIRSDLLPGTLKLSYIAVSFLSARLLSEVSLKLIQIDWLPSSRTVWDSSLFINDASEIGRFFHALIGYEAKPSISHIIFYFIGLTAPLFILKKTTNNVASIKEECL